MKTDDEVKNIAGHPDAIPEIYREWFLKGWRAHENEHDCDDGIMAQLLPCDRYTCRNIHEYEYRGCSLCKFKKTNQPAR